MSDKKKTWRRPTMTPHLVGGLNKFGTGGAPIHLTAIDGIAIDELIERFGSPLFV